MWNHRFINLVWRRHKQENRESMLPHRPMQKRLQRHPMNIIYGGIRCNGFHGLFEDEIS